MNYIKWDDFNPKDYAELREAFKPSFIKLLPNNSKASYLFHYKKYKAMMCRDFELRKTFTEELERFESYLIETYQLKLETHE